jgi:propanol-preferring alcohol dehydrogenase
MKEQNMSTTMKAAVVRAFGKPLAIEEVPVPVPGPCDVVLKHITVRGSIVGTRRLDEAIAFAVRAEITKAPLTDINQIFERMKSGRIDDRMVLDFA